MVGESLSMRKMCSLVKSLHELKHPWNCPHGRPTMRHLTTTSARTEKDNRFNEAPLTNFNDLPTIAHTTVSNL